MISRRIREICLKINKFKECIKKGGKSFGRNEKN